MYCHVGYLILAKFVPGIAVKRGYPKKQRIEKSLGGTHSPNRVNKVYLTNLCSDVTSTYSMRSLRSSLASSSLGAASASSLASRAIRQAESVTAYTAAPKKKLNLVELQVMLVAKSRYINTNLVLIACLILVILHSSLIMTRRNLLMSSRRDTRVTLRTANRGREGCGRRSLRAEDRPRRRPTHSPTGCIFLILFSSTSSNISPIG